MRGAYDKQEEDTHGRFRRTTQGLGDNRGSRMGTFVSDVAYQKIPCSFVSVRHTLERGL